MDPNTNTEAGQIAALALAGAGSAQLLTGPDGRTFAVVPKNVELKDVTSPNAATTLKPDVIKQVVTLQTAESLIAYVQRFKTTNTVLFADIENDTIIAAIDYHGQTDADLVSHKAILALERSVEWKLWDKIDGELLSQLDFARHIEEHADHFTRPDPASLLELVNNVQAIESIDFRAKTRTNSENVDFDVKVTADAFGHVAGEKLTLPNRFEVSIPIYFGEGEVPLAARLRWKKSQAEGLKLGIMLLKKEETRQAEFKTVVEKITAAVNLTSIYGRLGS